MTSLLMSNSPPFPCQPNLVLFPFSRVIAGSAKALIFCRSNRVFFSKLMSGFAMSSTHLRLHSGGNSFLRESMCLICLGANNIRERKSFLRALNNRISFFTAHLGKVCGPISNPFNSNPSGRSGISRLFCNRRPSAIGRLVVAVRVDSINRVLWSWFLSHISFKRSEVHPLFAYRDSPSSIVLPRTRVWVQTPLFHAKPCVIKRGLVNIGHDLLSGKGTDTMHEMPYHARGSR